MRRANLRQIPRKSYFEPEEPPFDEYIFCDECNDYVYEYCALHGPLLVIPDDEVPKETNLPTYVPRAALTIPKVFLHLAASTIPGAGIGVFTSVAIPKGVRFGPYRGERTNEIKSMYCWQLYDKNNKASLVVDADDGAISNWMRFVNCSRHFSEQNLVAFQYKGELYYRTIRTIPRFTELLVFYGAQFATILKVNLSVYNSLSVQIRYFRATPAKKPRLEIEENVEKNTTLPEVALATSSEVKSPSTNTNIKNTKKINKTKRKSDTKKKENIIFKEKSITVQKIDNSEQKPGAETNLKVTDKLMCNECNKSFDDKLQIIQHIKFHDLIKATKFNCKECNYTCKSNESLQYHMKLHDKNNREKIFSSTNLKTKNNENLGKKTHLRTHTGEKPFHCTICSKEFTVSHNLKTHLRTHTGEKPFNCTICSKEFTQSIHLKTHLRTHSGEKPFNCTICSKEFNQSSNLKTHLKTHTGEKPFHCTLCSKEFTHSSNLNTHLRIHTGEKPFNCTICSKKFTESGTLKIHLRTHTGEKPFHCTICPKKCTTSSDLKKHMRIHTGEKPYICDICDIAFTHSNSLKWHIMKTHVTAKS